MIAISAKFVFFMVLYAILSMFAISADFTRFVVLYVMHLQL